MKRETYICDLCKSEFFKSRNRGDSVTAWWTFTAVNEMYSFIMRFKRFIMSTFLNEDRFKKLENIEDICPSCGEDIENYILGKVK